MSSGWQTAKRYGGYGPGVKKLKRMRSKAKRRMWKSERRKDPDELLLPKDMSGARDLI